jgi:hypothetical protein
LEKRVGLLATQSIRGGANRAVLDRIKKHGDIFFAISDRPWWDETTLVQISMVGFDDGTERQKSLDGVAVSSINSDLTTGTDLTRARPLEANQGIWCYGSQQKAKFDIPLALALEMLHEPNSWGCPNSDVLRISVGAKQMTQRTKETFVIDFGTIEDEDLAARYERPFEYVRSSIYPIRRKRRETRQKKFWWLHARPSPRYREAMAKLGRYLVVPGTGKNRVFAWQDPSVLVDHALVVFRREDDYFFGILQSKVHACWAWRKATQLRERKSGLRYTATTCFETFPFPREPFTVLRRDITKAAKELDALRNRWLNPPEWTRTETLEFPGSVDGPWRRYVHDPDSDGVGTVRYPRTVPKNAVCAAKLKSRTLTNLYNNSPEWLKTAHKKLDELVFAAYGWPASLSDDDLLARLLELNLSRADTIAPSEVEVGSEGPYKVIPAGPSGTTGGRTRSTRR